MVITDELAARFKVDGSLRDLYIHGVTPAEWDVWYTFILAQGYPLTYRKNGEFEDVPSAASPLVTTQDAAHCLLFDIGEIQVACHFFCEDEIELDVDPRDFDQPSKIVKLAGFMRECGQLLSKDVLCTEENSPNEIVMRYEFGQDVLSS